MVLELVSCNTMLLCSYWYYLWCHFCGWALQVQGPRFTQLALSGQITVAIRCQFNTNSNIYKNSLIKVRELRLFWGINHWIIGHFFFFSFFFYHHSHSQVWVFICQKRKNQFIKVGIDANSNSKWFWLWNYIHNLHCSILYFWPLSICHVTMPHIKSWSVKSLHKWAVLQMPAATIKPIWLPMWISSLQL